MPWFSRADRDRQTARPRHTGAWYSLRIVLWLLIIGLVLIAVYAFATPGPHLSYASVGMLVAAAALAAGALIGFVLGVPKVVSSGEIRMRESNRNAGEAPAMQAAAADGGAAAGAGTATGRDLNFLPSSNLAEISDWLTKLLLGAGLVGLTKLGAPLGVLVHTVASGLAEPSPTGTVSGAAVVTAGAIVCFYLVLGVLFGYVVTTLGYTGQLNRGSR